MHSYLSPYFVSLDVLLGTASILSLVAISIERMAAVRHPTHHYNMSSRPVFVSIFLTWIIGFVLFGVKFSVNFSYIREYTISVFLVSFALPLLIIIWSYIILFKSAYNLQRADNQSRAHSIKRDIRIAKTISIIVGLFFICWAPFFSMNILFITCERCLSNHDFIIFIGLSKIMHYSNSMMNFFVYAVRSPEFRRAFKALICLKCEAKQLRDKIRTLSEASRKRGASLLKPRGSNNNADSFIDMEERSPEKVKSKDENGVDEKSFLMVPATTVQQQPTKGEHPTIKTSNSSSVNSDTVLTEIGSYQYPQVF